MESIYSSEYATLDDMVTEHGLRYHGKFFYHPPEFIPLTPMEFLPTDQYQLFLIEANTKMDRIKVQHFVVVIKRSYVRRGGSRASDIMYSPHPDKFYSMGFGSGPLDQFVLESPDPFFKKRTDLTTLGAYALHEFQALGGYADSLNELISEYTLGGYTKFSTGTGYFSVHSSQRKKYSSTGNMCLTGFDSIFPIPREKLKNLERLCYFVSTGKNTRRKRKRPRKLTTSKK
jgi:hypothetical protein